MAKQRWRARWIENGREREFLFDSLNNRMIARIDFRLKCACAENELWNVPEAFELEEVFYGERSKHEQGAAFARHTQGQQG